jgi:hypothetical protein
MAQRIFASRAEFIQDEFNWSGTAGNEPGHGIEGQFQTKNAAAPGCRGRPHLLIVLDEG